jgi:hypothetical protein
MIRPLYLRNPVNNRKQLVCGDFETLNAVICGTLGITLTYCRFLDVYCVFDCTLFPNEGQKGLKIIVFLTM